ncbi:phage virion morphogenesis protein [Rhodonellum sp.]|uniref:phage virion morphogenesis protein n=1 Tax=Rhodonellum sp. TaxID=2231180 RepID=UPI002728C616|nr:phage virion morphogenesis protein [Rhodonellum sp.]MDO9554540.1 phage virion morphogenesis protein [Rhodonellum sp.]
MGKNKQEIEAFFQEHKRFFDKQAPAIIAKTAVEYYKARFTEKNWDGNAWPEISKTYKPKRGSLMVRSSKLMNSIRDTQTTQTKVVISAGNSKVPYAKIHNEGGTITRGARSETFVRNRYKKGPKSKAFGGMGLFRKGVEPGKGLSFKAYTISIPKRQFMGYAASLNEKIIQRFKDAYKFK